MIDHPSSNETTLLTYPKPESNKSDTVQKFNPSHRTLSGRKSLSKPFPNNSGRSIEERNERIPRHHHLNECLKLMNAASLPRHTSPTHFDYAYIKVKRKSPSKQTPEGVARGLAREEDRCKRLASRGGGKISVEVCLCSIRQLNPEFSQPPFSRFDNESRCQPVDRGELDRSNEPSEKHLLLSETV